MQIKSKKEKNNLIIYLIGELDQSISKKVRDELDDILDCNLISDNVIFDFTDLSFIDSTGIGLIIGRYKKLKALNIDSFIKGANPNIEKIIYLSGLYKIMPKC